MSATYFRLWMPGSGWHLMEWVLYPDGRAKCWYDYTPAPVREAP